CAPTEADVAGLASDVDGVRLTLGPRGLTCQRNEILRQASEFDVLVFFDDDFFCDSSYLGVIEQVFSHHPEVVMATGTLIADGILGPGIAIADALIALEAVTRGETRSGIVSDVYS